MEEEEGGGREGEGRVEGSPSRVAVGDGVGHGRWEGDGARTGGEKRAVREGEGVGAADDHSMRHTGAAGEGASWAVPGVGWAVAWGENVERGDGWRGCASPPPVIRHGCATTAAAVLWLRCGHLSGVVPCG